MRSVDDEEILRAWRRGWDTYRIATEVLGSRQSEAQVERRLHSLLEQARTEDEWTKFQPRDPNPSS